MLVLSRKRDEDVVIDLRKHGLGLIEVRTVEIRGDKVRYGFKSRKDIPINRREVFDDMERQGEV